MEIKRSDKKENILDDIKRASHRYVQYITICRDIVKEVQKHIDWGDIVSCECYPGDGICIMIDENVCNAATFFELVEESENGMVDRKTFIRNCI